VTTTSGSSVCRTTASTVRPGIRTGDLIALIKGMFASLDGSADQARRDVVFAVLTDGLRPPR